MQFLRHCLPSNANITTAEARKLFGSDEDSKSDENSASNELTDADLTALEGRLKTKLTTEEAEKAMKVFRKFRTDATAAERKEGGVK